MACWKFIRVTSSGRHEYECAHCGHGFWFMPGVELKQDGSPTWDQCPGCAGWAVMPIKALHGRNPA